MLQAKANAVTPQEESVPIYRRITYPLLKAQIKQSPFSLHLERACTADVFTDLTSKESLLRNQRQV